MSCEKICFSNKEGFAAGCVDGIVIAGTTEGRMVIETLHQAGYSLAVTVATDLGKEVLGDIIHYENVAVYIGRKDQSGFERLIAEIHPRFVVDASHPFAVEVSKNAKNACGNQGVPYIRFTRPESPTDSICRRTAENDTGPEILYADNALQAAEILNGINGNILLTTGANTAGVYRENIPDFSERCYIRILDTQASVEACILAGVPPENMIKGRPPFSCKDNDILIGKYHIQVLVSKDSGAVGGLPEKLASAKKAGIPVVLIRRPDEVQQEEKTETAIFSLELLLEMVNEYRRF